MSIVEIPFEFIRKNTELSWADLQFGLEHGYLHPSAAIAKASEELSKAGEPSTEIIELATRNPEDPVTDLVAALVGVEKHSGSPHAKEKCLYLTLAWLFENRESLVDPLGLVEAVYSDFDYPREIASFVRYMPMTEPDLRNREQNEARIFEHWKAYLEREKRRFGQ